MVFVVVVNDDEEEPVFGIHDHDDKDNLLEVCDFPSAQRRMPRGRTDNDFQYVRILQHRM